MPKIKVVDRTPSADKNSGMSHIFVPSGGPSAWKQFLAKPDLQWATGYSAKTIAHSWEAQSDWPPEVANIIQQVVGQTALLLAIPEHKTPLPGGRRESQSDVFAIGRHAAGLIACTIEGKVDEPFGPTIVEQMTEASEGKLERLNYLCATLGIDNCPGEIHYQLLHRTVSALIEAERFATRDAAMIVHSFSPTRRWFDAFKRFAQLLGVDVEPDRSAAVQLPSGRRLILGWATGNQQFRSI